MSQGSSSTPNVPPEVGLVSPLSSTGTALPRIVTSNRPIIEVNPKAVTRLEKGKFTVPNVRKLEYEYEALPTTQRTHFNISTAMDGEIV